MGIKRNPKDTEFDEWGNPINKDYCHNCEEELKVVDVPSGYQEDYCTPCNEDINYFTCRNCDEEVEVADTFCSKSCYKEYWEFCN